MKPPRRRDAGKRTANIWLVLCNDRIYETARSRNGAIAWRDIGPRDPSERWRVVRVPVEWRTEPPKRKR